MKKELSYDDRVAEYLKKVKQSRTVTLRGYYDRFSDGKSMSNWYSLENKRLRTEYQKQQEISKERIQEIISFSRIDQYRYDELESKKLPFEKKFLEYQKQVQQLQRNVRPSDHLTFSDHTKMDSWLSSQQAKIEQQLKTSKTLSLERQREIKNLKELQKLIDSYHQPGRISFYQKAEEFHQQLYILGRPFCQTDKYYFSDGSIMDISWFEKQLQNYRNKYQKKAYQHEYKKRFQVLLDLYTSIESLKEENHCLKKTI